MTFIHHFCALSANGCCMKCLCSHTSARVGINPTLRRPVLLHWQRVGEVVTFVAQSTGCWFVVDTPGKALWRIRTSLLTYTTTCVMDYLFLCCAGWGGIEPAALFSRVGQKWGGGSASACRPELSGVLCQEMWCKSYC
jgi:hypothetical protein